MFEKSCMFYKIVDKFRASRFKIRYDQIILKQV